MTLSRIALMGGPVYDSDAKAVFTSLVQAGVTLSFAQKRAINTFLRGEKASGRWVSQKMFCLPIWGLAAANAVNWVNRSSGTFTGSVTHASGYVEGDGTTGYFDPSMTSVTNFGWTPGSASLGFLCTQADTRSDIRHFCGYTTGGTPRTCINQTTTDLAFSHSSTSVSNSVASTTEVGIIHMNATSTTARELRKRVTAGVSQVVATTTEDTTAVTNQAVYFLCRNAAAGASAFTNARMGAYFGGAGMSSADSDAFTLALKTLWESLTGLALP